MLIVDLIWCQNCSLLKLKKRFGRKQEDGMQWIRYVVLEMSINCVSNVMFTCFDENFYSTLFTERGHAQNSAGHERSQPQSWLLLVQADPNSLSFARASVVGTFSASSHSVFSVLGVFGHALFENGCAGPVQK